MCFVLWQVKHDIYQYVTLNILLLISGQLIKEVTEHMFQTCTIKNHNIKNIVGCAFTAVEVRTFFCKVSALGLGDIVIL